MNMKLITPLIEGIVTVALMTACSPSPSEDDLPLPPVNAENCSEKSLKAIKSEKRRYKISDACVFRGEFKPSIERKW